MRYIVALAIALALAAPAAGAVPPGYPKHPVGSILTSPKDRSFQFIIMIPDHPAEFSREIHDLVTLAAVRNALVSRYHLSRRSGHVPKPGNVLAWLVTQRFGSTQIYIAAWAPRASAKRWAYHFDIDVSKAQGWRWLYVIR